jgi:hypothetical protein
VSEVTEAILKLVIIAGLIGFLTWFGRGGWAAHRRRVLIGLAVLGGLGWFNFGRFHTDGSPLHVWDQFHYMVGSKYYPELGYDGMYAAMLTARQEVHPNDPLPRVRDLRTTQVVSALPPEYLAEVRGRFTQARWEEFRTDANRFYMHKDLFLDHGYLATPARTFIERLFSNHLAFRTRNVYLLATIDYLLLALVALALHRAFGLEVLAGAALVYGYGYCTRYYWMGGAFLRQDWFAGVIVGAAALRLRRFGLAGGALGYAAWARIFPGFLLPALAAFAAGVWWRGGRQATPEQRRAVVRFAAGLAGVSALMLVAGCLAGRGSGAWFEWLQRIRMHAGTIGPNAMGVRVPLSASLANLRGDLVDPTTLYDFARVASDFAQRGQERWWLIALASSLLVALSLRRAFHSSDPAVALAAGVGIIFAVVTPSCYYGSFFVLLALDRPLRTTRIFLAASAGMFLAAAATFTLDRLGVIRLNGAAVYVPVSLLLLVVLVDWLWVRKRSLSATA